MAHPGNWIGAGLVLLTAACSSERESQNDAEEHETPVVPSKVPEVEALGLPLPPMNQGIQLRQTFGPMDPGKEVHFCQYFVLPDRSIDVARFEHTYTRGGHHVILYPTELAAADVEGRTEAFDCEEEPSRGDAGFAYVGADVEGELTYPEGVARHFEPGSVVLLESHMLNVGQEPLDVDYRLNLWYAQAAVEHHVGTIFFYDNSIYIPEAGEFTARMSCRVPQDINVLSLIPHMHTRGVNFESYLVSEGGDSKPLAFSTDWAELAFEAYDPPLAITAGQRIDFICDYQNPDPRPVVEGGSKTENEMCLMIGYYYPRLDFPFEFCMSPESGPVFDGDKTCGETFQCFTGAADPVEAEKCAVQTCEASSQAYNDFFSCATLNCFFAGKCQGTANDPQCDSCAIEECANQITACMETGCE